MRLASACFLVLAALTTAALCASAGEAPLAYGVSVQIVDGEPAMLVLQAQADLRKVKAQITRRADKKRHLFEAKNLQAGDEKTFTWEQKQLQATYDLRIDIDMPDGEKHSIEGDFEVILLRTLDAHVDFSATDLQDGYLTLTSERKIQRVLLEVYDGARRPIAAQEQALTPTKRVRLEWDNADHTAVYVRIEAYENDDTWAEVQLFAIDVPHEDVVFDSGEAVIRPDQVGKLQHTLDFIEETLATYDEVSLALYVAGYTDTVGSSADNLALSERRARAIATWFRQHLRIPIAYQGFGEEVLANPTPDNTDDARNRRAVYLLTNATPGVTADFPRAAWKNLH